MNAPQALPGGPGVPQPLPQTGTHWDQDQVLMKYLHSRCTTKSTLNPPYRILFISMDHFIFFFFIYIRDSIVMHFNDKKKKKTQLKNSLIESLFCSVSPCKLVWILFGAGIRHRIFTSACP